MLVSIPKHESIVEDVLEVRLIDVLPYFSLILPQAVVAALPDADPDHLAAHVTVLAQFADRASGAFEQHSDVITSFLLKQILMKPIIVEEVRHFRFYVRHPLTGIYCRMKWRQTKNG